MFKQITRWVETSETIKQARIDNHGLPFWKEVIKFILLTIFLEFTITALIDIPIISMKTNPNTALIIKLFSTMILILIYLLFILKVEKRNLRSIGFSKDNILSSYSKGFLIGFLMISFVVIIGLLLGEYNFKSFNMNNLYLFLPFLLGFMVQSMKEEIYTRGWIMISIARKNNIMPAIIFSSLSFVFLHVFNSGMGILAVINIFIVGVFLSLLFLRFDNIWISGAFHASWNFLLSYFYGLNVSGIKFASFMSISQTHYSLLGGNAFGPEAGLLTTIASLIGIAIILYYKPIKEENWIIKPLYLFIILYLNNKSMKKNSHEMIHTTQYSLVFI